MSASRSPFRYSRPGTPFDQIPLEVFGGITGWAGYSSDLVAYTGPVAEGTDGGIILRGTVGTSTITRAGVASRSNVGYIRATCSNTEDDNLVLEFPSYHVYEVGVRACVFMRFALSDADDCEFGFGWMTPGVTDFVATLPVEGIYFSKAETAVDLDFTVRDNSTSTTDTTFSNSTLLADATMVIVGFTIDNSGNITPWYGTSINALTAGTVVAAGTANLPDDAGDEMSFTVVLETGAATANYVDIDWIVSLQER